MSAEMAEDVRSFENLTLKQFEAYLRKLQESPYRWPNDYFAWKKPDGSLFMVGVASGQMYHILNHELAKDCMPHMAENDQDYVSYQYSISPTTVHMLPSKDGLVRYDPVDALVKKISGFEYMGTWRDPDILMDSKTSYNRVLACGRWDLAMEHIQCNMKQKPLDDRISDAQQRSEKGPSRSEAAPEPER